jgi:hypothetical protein
MEKLTLVEEEEQKPQIKNISSIQTEKETLMTAR